MDPTLTERNRRVLLYLIATSIVALWLALSNATTDWKSGDARVAVERLAP